MQGPTNGGVGPIPSRITEDSAAPRKGWARQRIGVSVVVLALLVYAVVMDGKSLIGPLIAIAIVVAIALFVAFIFGRWERHPANAYWRGFVSFDENDFENRVLFPNITRNHRRSLGRQALSGGKLLIARDGISWEAGSMATPRCEISGSFRLPWERIEVVDVSRIPMKANFLGGAVTFHINGDDCELYGEFLGSRKTLLRALRRTPLGQTP
jgi:hypothetical protein